MATIKDISRYLNNNAVRFEVLSHQPAFTAHEVAVAVHVPDIELAKTLIVNIDGKQWMAVLAGNQRVSLRLLKRLFAANHIQLTHEEDLDAIFPGCERGAMPPFGNLYGLPVLVEQSITEDEEIVFNAGKHTESVKIRFEDFKRLVHPLVGQFAEARQDVED